MLDEPLGLTVHSLPSPAQAEDDVQRRTVRGRWRLLALMAVCAAPVVASYFTYYVVRPETRRSYGQLIEPQRPLPQFAATGLDGKSQPLAALKGQWLLISVAGGSCDPACERHLYLQRQLREGLGKDKDRMDWVWLVPDAAPVRPALLPALSQATVLRVPGEQLAQWLPAAAGHGMQEHLFLVDPLGNLMMRFPAALDPGSAPQAKRDLDRLMRASAGWDRPGRETPAQ
ncbi:hypothetical protein ACFPOE_00560 [Caenimonas terrae]|uniref:Thioredoxin domain-containing protein n=1 Tax=Caenimonas terrae TaxID=696074 RepID=A0ABW0N5S0_9BURK